MIQVDYLDLFAGAGGWHEGAKALGLSGTGIELNPAACKTLRAAGHDALETDVESALARSCAAALYASGLIASPPCPTFSVSGKGAGRRDMPKILEALKLWTTTCPLGTWEDERTALVLAPLRYILTRAAADRHFKWIAFEQVRECEPVWLGYAEILESIGYDVVVQKVDAYDFGVPQNRKRVVLMASHEHPVHELDEFRPGLGFAEALGLSGDWTTLNGTSRGGTKLLGVRHSPRPSFTLTGKCTSGRIIEGHVELQPRGTTAGRRLAVAECGVLQGFRADYPWQGGATEQRQQVGNAVPPPLAQAILRNLIDPLGVQAS